MVTESPLANWCYPEYLYVQRGANDHSSYHDAVGLVLQSANGDYRLALAHGQPGLCDLFDSVGVTTYRKSGIPGGQKALDYFNPKKKPPSDKESHWVLTNDLPEMVNAQLPGLAIAWVALREGGLLSLVFSMDNIEPRGAFLFPFNPAKYAPS